MSHISLRPLSVADIEQKTILFKDKDLIFNLGNRHVTFDSVTIESERAFFKEQMARTNEKKDLVLEILLDGKIIGIIGTKGIDFEKLESEIGYWIGKAYWGKGYATKAVKLFVKQFFDNFNIKRLYAFSFESNPASAKVLEKNGFKFFRKENTTHPHTGEPMVDLWYEKFKD